MQNLLKNYIKIKELKFSEVLKISDISILSMLTFGGETREGRIKS